jgi:hypothetical protein
VEQSGVVQYPRICDGDPATQWYSGTDWWRTQGILTRLLHFISPLIFQDQYDQYFMVYNDVIVCLDSSADEFEIYGPTDAHTATFIPSLNAILILGNMSAPETDQDITANSSAPVYILDLDTWNMTKGEIVSDGPGIIWLHAAALNKGVLRVTASQGTSFTTQRLVSMKDGKREKVKIEHRETWELDVAKWTWKHQAGDRETVQKKKKKKRDDSRRRGRGH